MNTLFRAFGVVVSAVVLVAGMVSCAKDTGVSDPYANWEERNVAFIDSIADVCANPPEGEIWRRYLDYAISFDEDLTGSLKPYVPANKDYVYVKFGCEGDILDEEELRKSGEEYPIMYGDTVMAAYQGFLINGVRFDGNYYGTFDREVNDNFTKFDVKDMRNNNGGLIGGWVNVLLHMKPRTMHNVEVYIPYQLAYGDIKKEKIPVKSALKFELYVDEVVKPGLPK